jgi:putative hydrolase of the HAD superfamily
MAKHRIEVVIFDHGGVLTRGGEKGTNEKAASRAMGLDFVIEIPDLNEALKCGRITNEQYVAEINRRYPRAPRILTMTMWDEVYASLTPDPLAYAFAQRCRDSGRRVGMLSSINPTMARRLHEDGSYRGFDPLILSCAVGCAKPDPQIYALVEARLPGIRPSQILFLDDQEKCLVGARNRRWQTLLVQSPEQMARDAGRLLGL